MTLRERHSHAHLTADVNWLFKFLGILGGSALFLSAFICGSILIVLGAFGASNIVLDSLGVLAVQLLFRFPGGLNLIDRRLSAFIGG
jgi:hypothetical protein